MTWSNQLLFLYKPMILISVNFCSVRNISIYRLYYPILITSILLYYLVDDRALYKVIGGRRDIHSLISSSSGLSLHISSTISNENVFFIFKGKLLHAFLLLFLKLQKENQVKMNQYNKKNTSFKDMFFSTALC